MRRQHFLPLIFPQFSRRNAQVHMRMPLGNAQRDALIELLFGKNLGRGIHHADQLVAIAMLFVQQ